MVWLYIKRPEEAPPPPVGIKSSQAAINPAWAERQQPQPGHGAWSFHPARKA